MVWCAHKAFMIGISLKLTTQEKRRKEKGLAVILSQIKDLKAFHITKPSQVLIFSCS